MLISAWVMLTAEKSYTGSNFENHKYLASINEMEAFLNYHATANVHLREMARKALFIEAR